MENLDEINYYKCLIATENINIKSCSEAVENLELRMGELRTLIGAIYSKRRIEKMHIDLMKRIEKELSIIEVKLAVYKNKVIKDGGKIVPYFEKLEDYKDEYVFKKSKFVSRVNRCQELNSALTVKTKNFIFENEIEVAEVK